MKVSKYMHHDAMVSVLKPLKGKHRQHCLCWNNCKFFFPDKPYNCEIARDNYRMCCRFNVTTPVYECAKYEPKETKESITKQRTKDRRKEPIVHKERK